MNRPIAAVLLLGLFVGVNFGLRTWRHWRATGSTGFLGLSGRVGSAEWFGGVLFGIGIALALAAPLADLGGMLSLLLSPRPWWTDAVAVGVVVLGIAGTTWVQSAMGESWRIGVRADERTELVERGPFRWVRNPIFSFMLVTAAGLVLLLTNALSIGALARGSQSRRGPAAACHAGSRRRGQTGRAQTTPRVPAPSVRRRPALMVIVGNPAPTLRSA